MILAFDTETTGKADFRAPSTATHQPYIVQLGAILFDNDWTVRGEINLIIRPEGWRVPEEAAAIHGITNEIAAKFGVHVSEALSCFRSFFAAADVCVAHNLSFDALVIGAAVTRLTQCVGFQGEIMDKGFCTMEAMTPICQLTGNYGDYKWPKLQEAYRHAFNEDFQGAHDAMADVRACARIYRWLTENKPNYEHRTSKN